MNLSSVYLFFVLTKLKDLIAFCNEIMVNYLLNSINQIMELTVNQSGY